MVSSTRLLLVAAELESEQSIGLYTNTVCSHVIISYDCSLLFGVTLPCTHVTILQTTIVVMTLQTRTVLF